MILTETKSVLFQSLNGQKGHPVPDRNADLWTLFSRFREAKPYSVEWHIYVQPTHGTSSLPLFPGGWISKISFWGTIQSLSILASYIDMYSTMVDSGLSLSFPFHGSIFFMCSTTTVPVLGFSPSLSSFSLPRMKSIADTSALSTWRRGSWTNGVLLWKANSVQFTNVLGHSPFWSSLQRRDKSFFLWVWSVKFYQPSKKKKKKDTIYYWQCRLLIQRKTICFNLCTSFSKSMFNILSASSIIWNKSGKNEKPRHTKFSTNIIVVKWGIHNPG